MRRDELRHREILASSEPELRLLADASQALAQPEHVVLAEQDRLIAWEFMTELSDGEKRTYELMVEGMSANRIARVCGIPVNEARRLVRACERKREAFQLLYEAGRLCGYRASTIRALLNAEPSTQELADRAFAHLESCAHCRAEHKTNANRLRRSFRDQAAALLPAPVLAAHPGWFERLGLRTRLIHHRLLTGNLPFWGGGVRERAGALLTGGGFAAAKLTAGTATLALLAGGAIDATRIMEHHARTRTPAPTANLSEDQPDPGESLQAFFASSWQVSAQRRVRRTPGRALSAAPGRVVGIPRRISVPPRLRQRDPGGFAFLGIPTSKPARVARRVPAPEQSGGGLFSP
jgi:hypothetical protein